MNLLQRRLLLSPPQAQDADEFGDDDAGEEAGPPGHADHIRGARPPLQVDAKEQCVRWSKAQSWLNDL